MIAEKYTTYMYNLVKRCVEEIGPREPCSQNEKKLARMMAEEWTPICDTVTTETFTCSPKAFLGFFPAVIILYLTAIALFMKLPALSFILSAAGITILYLELFRYHELTDILHKKQQGQNVIGVIKPSGETKRRVIICGHTDSAYEFNIWYILKNAAVPFMIFGVLGMLFVTGSSLAHAISIYKGTHPPVYATLWYIMIALAPVLSVFAFFHTGRVVPGAMDDMAGVSIAAGLGKYLHDAKTTGQFFPQNTEVILLAMACEEAGLRGAKRYVKQHLSELKSTPTHALIFDGICDEKHLSVITREICTSAKHDPKLVNLAIQSAAAIGVPIKKTLVPLGASDATEFSNAGISSTCIVCQDTTRLVPNYHTRHDTLENMNPQSLTVSLQLAIDMLEQIDKTF